MLSEASGAAADSRGAAVAATSAADNDGRRSDSAVDRLDCVGLKLATLGEPPPESRRRSASATTFVAPKFTGAAPFSMAIFCRESRDADVISAADDSMVSKVGDFEPAILAMAAVSALKALVGFGASAMDRRTIEACELVSICVRESGLCSLLLSIASEARTAGLGSPPEPV